MIDQINITTRGDIMALAMINFRMDEGLKKNMEKTCRAMGLTMTAAFTAFALKD